MKSTLVLLLLVLSNQLDKFIAAPIEIPNGQSNEGEEENQLTESQIAKFRMAFNVYDKEGRGEIRTSLLGSVMKNLGYNLKPEELEDCITTVDPTNTGTIKFNNFLALMAKKTKQAEDEAELREAFRVFDTKNLGVIDVSDLKLIFKTLDPDMPDEEIDQIISEVDEDGSGTVDFEEFMKLMSG